MAAGVTIKLRRDSTANWTSVDPTPGEGEICYDLTLKTFKIGDGSTAWSVLTAYSKIPVSVAASDFLVGDSTTGNWIKKTLAEVKTILGLGGTVATSSALNDFLVGDSTTGNWKKATLAEVKTALGLSGTVGGNVAASAATSDFLVGDSTTGNWIKKTLAEARTILFGGGTIDGGGAS